MDATATMAQAPPPPPPAPPLSALNIKLPQLSIRGGAMVSTPAPLPEGGSNKLMAPGPQRVQQSGQASPRSGSTGSWPSSSSPNAKPAQFVLALSSTSSCTSNQNQPSGGTRSSPSPVESSVTTTSFLSPSTLSGTTLLHGATTTDLDASSSSSALLLDANGKRIKVVLSDPESPAFAALIQANHHEKSDISLLAKRPRIGHSKLGRHKYKADSKSFSSTDKTKTKKPAGKEIHFQHEQYALTYGMMCGILNSAGLQNPFKQRLTMDDFMRVDKRVFPPNSKLRHPFKFKDYSPDIFRQIRRRFCIDSADYMVTLCGDFNYIEFMSNSKSGQFFFYSHDGRFMIKTQTKEESKFLRRILPHYYKFVMENPNTLITRFYGMHRVKMHHLRRKMHFIIMASVFDTPLEIQARFDLKGSTIGRRGTPEDKNSHGVLKDMDLVDSQFRLQVGAEKRAMLLVQIRKDVEFLKRMKIMDYSLLIGVHDQKAQIQNTIYGSPFPQPSAVAAPAPLSGGGGGGSSKSLPASPLGETATADAKGGGGGGGAGAFANGELPVRLARSVSVPEDSRMGVREGMPVATAPSPPPPASFSSSSSSSSVFALGASGCVEETSGYDVDQALATYCEEGEDDESDSSSDDLYSCSSSNLSDAGGDSFAVDRVLGFEMPASPSMATTASLPSSRPGLHTAPSMASSLHALEPISPRVLDVQRFPGHSESVFCKDEGGIYGRDKHGRKNGFVYFIGVIDILQQYNTRKIAENLIKGFLHDRKEISSVNPVYYGDRFIEFMEKNVILDETLAASASPSSSSMTSSMVGGRASASASTNKTIATPSLSTLQQL